MQTKFNFLPLLGLFGPKLNYDFTFSLRGYSVNEKKTIVILSFTLKTKRRGRKPTTRFGPTLPYFGVPGRPTVRFPGVKRFLRFPTLKF